MQKRIDGKIVLYTIFEILALLVLLMFMGLFDLMSFTFDFSRVSTWEYWSQIMVNAAAYGAAMALAYITKLERDYTKNDTFLKLKEKYSELLKLKTQTFPIWTQTVLNPRIQREAYDAAMNKKLYKLDKRANNQSRIDYYELMKSKKPFGEFEFESKRSRKYCKKRMDIERLMSSEIADEQAKSYPHYTRVSPYAFTTDVGIDVGFKENPNEVQNKAGMEITLRVARKILTVFLVALMTGSITTTLVGVDMPALAIIVQITSLVIAMGWSWFSGWFLGRSIFKRHYIDILEHRIRFLKEYSAWQSTTGEKDSATYKISLYLEEQDKIKERREKTLESESKGGPDEK